MNDRPATGSGLERPRTWSARVAAALGAIAAVTALAAACGGGSATARITAEAQYRGTHVASQRPPQCAPPGPSLPTVTATTITTIEQAYYCILANYYSGPVLHDQMLLIGAFAGFTQELDRLGVDQPDATMPRLTGNRDRDWAAFAAVYRRVISQVPDIAARRQALAAATINGIVASLDDNHARWDHLQWPPGFTRSDDYGLGITTSPIDTLTSDAPLEALPPLFVTEVDAGSPAARARIRPGDVILSVNGAPPFADGLVSPGVIDLLYAPYPQAGTVLMRLRRPATGHTWTASVTPAAYYAAVQAASARLVSGDIAYVKLPKFLPGAAEQVLHAISALGKAATLHGVILDLRGNSGGAPPEVARLLGAFVHRAAWSYDCDFRGTCTPNYTDDSVPLLHLPLVVLTDRDCASACDAFSGAVKDLHVGSLVGTRTSGIVTGPAMGFVLDDGSILSLPAEHELSANHETINAIGVAPDFYIPLTARDLSTGHDPDVAKALTLLGR